MGATAISAGGSPSGVFVSGFFVFQRGEPTGSGAVVLAGNVDGSKLWKALTHSEEPYMPPNRPRLDGKDLDIFKKWIAGGLLENVGGKAVAASALSVDLTLKLDSIGKPDGPPAMPHELPVEPVVHTARMNAITGLASSPGLPSWPWPVRNKFCSTTPPISTCWAFCHLKTVYR